jgi:Flp pilus assembly protein TadG
MSCRVRAARADDGAAVAEFALVAVLLIFLFLAVAQVGVYLHVRNVVTASAAEGARYAANADVPAEAGGPRAAALIGTSVGPLTGAALSCRSSQVAGPAGVPVVEVDCEGAVPVFFAPLGRVIPLRTSARAVEEAP